MALCSTWLLQCMTCHVYPHRLAWVKGESRVIGVFFKNNFVLDACWFDWFQINHYHFLIIRNSKWTCCVNINFTNIWFSLHAVLTSYLFEINVIKQQTWILKFTLDSDTSLNNKKSEWRAATSQMGKISGQKLRAAISGIVNCHGSC